MPRSIIMVFVLMSMLREGKDLGECVKKATFDEEQQTCKQIFTMYDNIVWIMTSQKQTFSLLLT